MKDYELKHLRKLLLKEKTHAHQVAMAHKELGFEDSSRDSTSELSTYDNHPADIATETFELEKQLALSRHQSNNIAEIDEALRKLDAGKYGLCDFCGGDIGFERLETMLTAKLCIKCENNRKIELEDLENDYPVEEDVIEPSFARTFLDRMDQSAYDGEDAWQDVQRYGSSSSPQDISVNGFVDYKNDYYEGGEEPESGYVEEVERISNAEYKRQLPDSHGNSDDGYVDDNEKKRPDIDFFGGDQ